MTFKKNYIPQVDESDCGVAALAMILKNYGSKYSIARLRNLAKTDKEGTTALGLIKTAQKLHFETRAIKADMSLFNEKNITYPFIAHVIKKGTVEHYYVILGKTKSHIIIADPDPTIKVTKLSNQRFASEWTGVSLFFAPTSEYRPEKVDKKESLLSFVPELFKQKKLVLNIVLAAIMITIISILGSYFLQTVIDTYIPNNMSSTLAVISMGLIILYVFQSILTYSRDFLLSILGQRLAIDIILGYIRHIFELPMEFFATRKTGEIVSRFNDANKIIDALASTIISIFLDVGTVIIMGTVLVIQNSTLFFITLFSLPIYFLIIWAFFKPFEKLNQKEMESGSILNSSIIEDIHGIETVKSLNSERQRYEKIDSEFVDYLKKGLNYTKIDTLQQAIKLFLQLVLSVIILWIGAIMVTKNRMSVGQLMTYNALLAYFINPLQNIINLQSKLQTAKVANNRLNEVYLVDSEFKEKRSLNNFSQLFGDIRIENVDYSYNYGENVLNNVSLNIRFNEKLTLVGMSGSGKSTLVKLLVNFFKPSKGKVYINNYDVQNINIHVLRQFINYIPQSPYIFSGSILENLTLGNRPNITNNDIMMACRIAEIDRDIEKMPLQFETVLDENGSLLSGGQKQRITIARALLSPARVLIFDESTSSLDPITENRIMNNIMKLKNLTVIFIAHRLSIAKKTNNVVVLDKGKVVEKGSHNELINKKGYYFNLWNN